MIIDVHGYFGKWPYWPLPQWSASELVQEMNSAGIDRAVITSTRSLFTSWKDGNCEARGAALQHPERLIAFDCAGPTELSHTLHGPRLELDGDPASKGLRLFPQYHTYHLLHEPFVDALCEQAAARSLPVQLPLRVLMNWGMPMLDIGWMVAIVKRHPRVPWILTGLNYFHELRIGIDLMRRYPTVHLDTSCIQGFEAIRKIVDECGSDRLLFGTGMLLQNAAANISKLRHAHISDTAREAIFGGNAIRVLRLSTNL